jgi:hypothetical protein
MNLELAMKVARSALHISLSLRERVGVRETIMAHATYIFRGGAGAMIVRPFAITTAVLSIFVSAPVNATGLYGIPQDINAKMYRLMAQQNRLSEDGTAYACGSGSWPSYTGIATGSGNLSLGAISQTSILAPVDMTILVDGDIVNINRGH